MLIQVDTETKNSAGARRRLFRQKQKPTWVLPWGGGFTKKRGLWGFGKTESVPFEPVIF